MKRVRIVYRSGQIVIKNFKEFSFKQNRYTDYDGNTKIRLNLDYIPLNGEEAYVNPLGIDFIEVMEA